MGGINERRPKFRTKAFEKMKRLRFLELKYVKLTRGSKYLPNKLRWLHWTGFTGWYMPKDFSLGEAVAIYLESSKIRWFLIDARVLTKLKILHLSDCEFIRKSPDFSTIPNLEKLLLRYCKDLREVHQSIGGLERLSLVNLEGCSSLEKLPRSFYQLKSVETLVLDHCERFEKLDEEIGDMTSLSTLSADHTAITELPSSIARLKNLRCLFLRDTLSWRIWKFLSIEVRRGTSHLDLKMPPSVQGLSSIVELGISDCNITNVAEDLGSLSSLKRLHISRSSFQSLPSLSGLSQLVSLVLPICDLTDELIKVMDLGSLYSMESLDLWGNSFSSLPSLRNLSKLVWLRFQFCRNLRAIPDLPISLKTLLAPDCTALKGMPDFSDMLNLTEMDLRNCVKLVVIPGLAESLKTSMRMLVMDGCSNITASFKKKIMQVSLSLSHTRSFFMHGIGMELHRT